MNNLKIGQEVLIKARVVEHNKHDKVIAIKKQDGAVERLVYVDYGSINTLYVTTQELLDEIDFMGLDVDRIYCNLGNRLEIYLPEDVCDDPIIVGIDNQYELAVPEDLFSVDYQFEFTKYMLHHFMQMLFRYAQTPIEKRG